MVQGNAINKLRFLGFQMSWRLWRLKLL